MKNKDGHRKFGILDSISYAAGDIGSNMSFALRPTLIIFWTQFMGMSSQLYALLLVIVQVWAAITDPIIGAMVDADRRVHKRNKFLTFISTTNALVENIFPSLNDFCVFDKT